MGTLILQSILWIRRQTTTRTNDSRFCKILHLNVLYIYRLLAAMRLKYENMNSFPCLFKDIQNGIDYQDTRILYIMRRYLMYMYDIFYLL